MAKEFLQGKYKPKNPDKYKGDINNIIYRSSWELKVLINLDNNPDVIEYSSEEVVIPYISRIDRKWHRYFIDFKIKRKMPDNTIKTFLVEVKPYIQTIPPKKPEKINKSYKQKVIEYARNYSKWEYAREYCKKHGYEFTILTEKELGI